MNNNQPPFLAQLLLALLTQPLHLAPSISGLRVVSGTSSSSLAREGVYRRDILDFEVEPAGVDISGKFEPALYISLIPYMKSRIIAHFLAYPCAMRVMDRILGDHVEDPIVFVGSGFEGSFAQWHIEE